MAAWILLVLVLAGLIFWQRQRLQRYGDSFDDAADEYRRPDDPGSGGSAA
jgi:hypothetical protein